MLPADACRLKSVYSTEEEARKVQAFDPGKRSVSLFPYRCPVCAGWHLSHQPGYDAERHARAREHGRYAVTPGVLNPPRLVFTQEGGGLR